MVATLGARNSLAVSLPGGTKLDLQPEQDFYPQRFSASGTVKAPVVYAGFGIHAPALGYDDYGDRVKGRIALILEHEPGERDPEEPVRRRRHRRSRGGHQEGAGRAGQGRGRRAVRHRRPQPPGAGQLRGLGPRLLAAAGAAHRSLHAGELGRSRAHSGGTDLAGPGRDSWFAAPADRCSTWRKRRKPNAGSPAWRSTASRPRLTTSVNRHIVPDRNVLAYIEGSDPKLKDEVVIVSAHYDHEGADGTVIYNGADDDGSGTVALIEIADAYAMAAAANQRPRRSVLFACWGSEERGPLLGAWAYTENPTFPLGRRPWPCSTWT